MYSTGLYQYRDYSGEADFRRIRNFIVSTWKTFHNHYNWTLERWAFSRFVAGTFNTVSQREWEAGIGIWERGGKIAAVVHSECERHGEVFFQLCSPELPEDLYYAMFNFAEQRLGKRGAENTTYEIRIPSQDLKRKVIAGKLGYIHSGKPNQLETTSRLTVKRRESRVDAELPMGCILADAGTHVDHAGWGTAHAKAFGYYGKMVLPGAEAHAALYNQAADYDPELDIFILDQHGDIVSFCIAWFDDVNRIGILEPVGTIPEFRRMGLGRVVIQQAARKLADRGITDLYVGSNQPFYLALGFIPDTVNEIWEKTVTP